MSAKKPSLYAQYIKETCNRGTVETKDGFATFEFINDKMVYIVDIYVVPKKRKTGVAKDLADSIVSAVKPMGVTQLLGSVDLGIKGAETSEKVLIAYGMVECLTQHHMKFFVKDI
jgi:predicted GNAT family acetyltransferase